MLVATAILNAAVVPPLAPYLVAPAVIAAVVAIVGARRSPVTGAPDVSVRNPLQLAAALQMAILFQAVLISSIVFDPERQTHADEHEDDEEDRRDEWHPLPEADPEEDRHEPDVRRPA